jgi:hypothetical protein
MSDKKLTFVDYHVIEVLRDGRKVGEIRSENEAGHAGYRYYPKGQKTGGAFYGLLSYCKASLEN